jgi:hypothetical protein
MFVVMANRGELLIKQQLQFKEVKIAKLDFDHAGD